MREIPSEKDPFEFLQWFIVSVAWSSVQGSGKGSGVMLWQPVWRLGLLGFIYPQGH